MVNPLWQIGTHTYFTHDYCHGHDTNGTFQIARGIDSRYAAIACTLTERFS